MRHRQAIALLALVGFFVALYLWLHNIGVIGELKCGSGGCETVQASAYARIAGVPVAFFGVVGYAVLFAVAYVGLQPAWAARPGPTRLLAALALGGVAFTAYLTYLELFVIHAICRWCVTSAAIITGIAVAALVGLARRPSA
ncbi:MAG TPA: vitamin K epoxide reductase family protein [Gemmatimonadales bacterium]